MMSLPARLFVVTLLVASCSAPAKKRLTAQGDPLKRASCSYGPDAGAMASETDDPGTPYGDSIPIEHIVLVMQENRSFDHYFSKLTIPGQTIDVASPDATNPDPVTDGGVVHREHQTKLCVEDVHHGWVDSHKEFNDGKMDGFAAANASTGDPTGSRSLSYYDESNLPFFYAEARTFAISDRHFASVMGPTQPNRCFYMAGTSFGHTTNVVGPTLADGSEPPTLFTRLDEAGVTWKDYSVDLPTPAEFIGYFATHQDHFAGLDQYFADAAAGTLPQVSIIDGSQSKGGASTSEHAPADFQLGQAHIAKVVKALIASPNWSRSALFHLYDEHGGFYDHVPPPAACEPDDIHAIEIPTAKFDHLGVRVPLLVVSPYAKRGFVSHVVTDHTSVLRFVEARFNLPALTKRDANATPPFDMFDFDHPNFDRPTLPDPPVNQSEADACAAAFPPPVKS